MPGVSIFKKLQGISNHYRWAMSQWQDNVPQRGRKPNGIADLVEEVA